MIKGHASIIGETGYNCHSRHFFKELSKLTLVQLRNFTVPPSWDGYINDHPFDNEPYMDDVLKHLMVEQTLFTENGRKEFPLYTDYKNEGTPNIHIVLNETNHHYFYEEYDGIKIAYNVWETTRQPEEFFERLKQFDQVWVPSEWQRKCTIEQGISSDKVKVVPEGVDVDMYKPINRIASMPTNRPFRFLLVGRWDYRKSTREIIESFVNTFSEDENVEMILSIDNPYAKDGLNSTEERLEKFGIRHKGLKVVHHLSKEEYVNMIKTCDVFVSCARGEGWNLPLIEAMSSGIPSLYSNWGAQLEFAEGKGIPVDISYERPAKVETDDFTWKWDAPGMFAEPNFNDLSDKMREVYENYSVHKRKALNDSDEIREKFTWKNSAKIANEILNQITNDNNKLDDSVAIILAHADTPKRKQLLKECLLSIKMDKILSTNYIVDGDIQSITDWVIYSKENPLLFPNEYDKYGVNYISWWKDESGKYNEKPFDYEHSYAVYDLTKRGIEFANSMGKKKIHIINYDYTISENTIKKHENLLETNDLVFYEYDDNKHGTSAYCSAFMSGKISTLYSYYGKYSSKEEYYKSMGGFNILEINLSEHFKNSDYKIKRLKMSSLSDENKIDQENGKNYSKLEKSNLLGKTLKEISDSFDCDKTTYHNYHNHYPMFLEKWRNDEINIFEIGLDEGKSMNLWQIYFPFAKIWGMDISKEYSNDRCKVFIGNQNNIDDLKKIKNQVPKCKVIVDDGSHVPEHQIKSFYYLFQNVLDWGGVYIIEDTECSYWSPDKKVYSFETGYLNLIEYFTKFNHQINSHYNLIENELHIKSITYGENCIIIEKKELNEIYNKEYRFKDRLSNSPDYKESEKEEKTMKNKININFIDGAFVEIVGNHKEKYLVKFIDKSTNALVFETSIENNQWARTDRKWFTDWKIEIHRDGNEPIIYDYNATGKRIFISLESSSLGDTIAWVPYLEEFRKKHNCKVIVSTFLNDLFEIEYPELNFVKPGSSVDNLYAMYRLGCFYDDRGFDKTKHKTDYRKLRLQEIATDILGLDFKEIKTRIYVQNKEKQINGDYVTIGIHSTAQLKYWNNGNGWQETVDYLNSKGIKTVHISKQIGEYMGNKPPQNIIDKTGDFSLQDRITDILNSKMFIGVSSGLSWVAWALGVPTILISGCTEEIHEPLDNVFRVINTNVCNSCFSNHYFDKGDWNWCPLHKGTDRQFECSKEIPFSMVQPKIDKILSI